MFKRFSEKEGGKGNQKRLGPVPTCDPLSLKVYLWKRGADIFAVAQTNQTAFTPSLFCRRIKPNILTKVAAAYFPDAHRPEEAFHV